MTLQQWTTDHRGLVGLAVITLLFGTALIYMLRESKSGPAAIGDEVWFTNDDGKSWFPAPPSTISPWEKDGKTAYRCYVFECDGEKFVAYLERLTPDAAKRVRQGVFDPMLTAAIEVADPGAGDKGWVKATDPKAAEIMSPRCPKHPGKMGTPVHP